eukprot:1428149-Alexandrium_andersonii.AAC.1
MQLSPASPQVLCMLGGCILPLDACGVSGCACLRDLARVPLGVPDVLQSMQHEFKQQAERQELSGVERRHALKAAGAEFFSAACKLLQQLPAPGDDASAWCVRCGRQCRLKPCLGPGEIWLEAAGNTCTPWSAAGLCQGWLDQQSIP